MQIGMQVPGPLTRTCRRSRRFFPLKIQVLLNASQSAGTGDEQALASHQVGLLAQYYPESGQECYQSRKYRGQIRLADLTASWYAEYQRCLDCALQYSLRLLDSLAERKSGLNIETGCTGVKVASICCAF